MRRVGLALALFTAAGLCLAAPGAPDPKSLLHVQATLTTAAPISPPSPTMMIARESLGLTLTLALGARADRLCFEAENALAGGLLQFLGDERILAART
jgi:hypothetical protein